MSLVANKIESLPPLPRTVIALENFRQQKDKDPVELQKIIEQDPLLVVEILKVANSAMFSFRSKVETISRAIGLLGINYIISIALGNAIKNIIKADLSPYGSNTDEFMESCTLSSVLVSLWVPSISKETAQELLLPAFLQQIGRFIIADIAQKNNKADIFLKLITSNEVPVFMVEKRLVGMTTTQVSANIFRHWQLSNDLVQSIEFVDDIEHAPNSYIQKNKILNIVNLICNIVHPLSEQNISNAIKQATKFGFDTNELQKAVSKLVSQREANLK